MFFRSLLLLLVLAIPAIEQDRVTREAFSSGGKTREYFLYAPPAPPGDAEAPLLVLLHGSGRDEKSLVDPWKNLAKKEGIVLVGPNATDRSGWDLGKDGPYFIADLVDVVRTAHRVDLKRIYIFGHSAGAIQGLMLGLLESEYFAAVAVHAGALPSTSFDLIGMADRKIPYAIWVGTNDSFFPIPGVEATKHAMEAKGLTVALTKIKNHTHNYYQRSREINAEAWKFLQGHRLAQNPKFKEYDFGHAPPPTRSAELSDTADAPVLEVSFPKGGVLMNKDELDGKVDQLKGKVKQATGDLTDNERLHDEGVADEASGNVQEGFGRGRRKVGEAIEDLGEKIKR